MKLDKVNDKELPPESLLRILRSFADHFKEKGIQNPKISIELALRGHVRLRAR